jgi:TonB family protein
MRPRLALALAFTSSLFAVSAQADFLGALEQYKKGDYEHARAEFSELAALGDGASQYNLGAMLMQGQGGPKDFGSGVGWLTAASENGYTGLPPDRLKTMQAKLSPEEKKAADGMVASYGRAAMDAHVLPAKDAFRMGCGERSQAKFKTRGLEYAQSLKQKGMNGVAILTITVAPDGTVHDPEVVMTVPDKGVAATAAQTVIRFSFEPITVDGKPATVRDHFNVKYVMDTTDGVWNIESLKKVRANAELGVPDHQFFMGLAGSIDPLPGFSSDDAATMLLKAAQGGQRKAQRLVAERLRANEKCLEQEKGKWERWLRASVRGGDNIARVQLASAMLEMQPLTPERLSESKSLLETAAESTEPYAVKHALAVLAASPIDEVRNPALAVKRAEFLRNEESVSDPASHEVIAAANAATGKFAAAVTSEKRALEKAKRLHWDTSLMSERLARYQNGQTWTGDLFALPTNL